MSKGILDTKKEIDWMTEKLKTCKNCKHHFTTAEQYPLHKCRRFPPVPVSVPMWSAYDAKVTHYEPMFNFPDVNEEDTCGEFTLITGLEGFNE